MNAVHARAFALGEHIAISPDDAQPTSTTSWRLLAHELAHVIRPGPEPVIQCNGDGDVCEAPPGEELTCEAGRRPPDRGPDDISVDPGRAGASAAHGAGAETG